MERSQKREKILFWGLVVLIVVVGHWSGVFRPKPSSSSLSEKTVTMKDQKSLSSSSRNRKSDGTPSGGQPLIENRVSIGMTDNTEKANTEGHSVTLKEKPKDETKRIIYDSLSDELRKGLPEEVAKNLPLWAYDFAEASRGSGRSGSDPNGKCVDSSQCLISNGCVSDRMGVCRKAAFEFRGEWSPSSISSSSSSKDSTPGNSTEVDAGGAARKTLPPPVQFPPAPRCGKSAREFKPLACSWMPLPSLLPKLPDKLAEYVPTQGALQDGSAAQIWKDKVAPSLNREDRIATFKHLTGSPTDIWYDWPSKVKEVESSSSLGDSGFQIRGRHLKSADGSKPYVLENFCINPHKRTIMGYINSSSSSSSPTSRLEGYKGLHDVRVGGMLDTNFYGAFQSMITQYLGVGVGNEVRFERLEEEPTWYVDQKLAFMPVFRHPIFSQESQKLLASMMNLAQNIEAAFPSSTTTAAAGYPTGGGNSNTTSSSNRRYLYPAKARSDVTMVYLMLKCPDHICGKTFPGWPVLRMTEHWRHTTLATQSHFAIFSDTTVGSSFFLKNIGRGHASFMKEWNLATKEAFIQKISSTKEASMLCFKEAVFHQTCHEDACKVKNPVEATVNAPGVRGRRISFVSWGWRSAKAQRSVARRLRECANLPLHAEDPEEVGTVGKLGTIVFLTSRNRLTHTPFHVSNLHDVLLNSFPSDPAMARRLRAYTVEDLSELELMRVLNEASITILAPDTEHALKYGMLMRRKGGRGGPPLLPSSASPSSTGVGLGSIIEMTHLKWTTPYTSITGLNKNPGTGIGGLAQAQGVHHLAVQLDYRSARLGALFRLRMIDIPSALMARALTTAIQLEQNGTAGIKNPFNEAKLPEGKSGSGTLKHDALNLDENENARAEDAENELFFTHEKNSSDARTLVDEADDDLEADYEKPNQGVNASQLAGNAGTGGSLMLNRQLDSLVPITTHEIDFWLRMQGRDFDGQQLRALIRQNLPLHYIPHARRLLSLYNEAPRVARFVSRGWKATGSQPHAGMPFVTVFSCERDGNISTRVMVELMKIEIVVFREYLPRSAPLKVLFETDSCLDIVAKLRYVMDVHLAQRDLGKNPEIDALMTRDLQPVDFCGFIRRGRTLSPKNGGDPDTVLSKVLGGLSVKKFSSDLCRGSSAMVVASEFNFGLALVDKFEQSNRKSIVMERQRKAKERLTHTAVVGRFMAHRFSVMVLNRNGSLISGL